MGLFDVLCEMACDFYDQRKAEEVDRTRAARKAQSKRDAERKFDREVEAVKKLPLSKYKHEAALAIVSCRYLTKNIKRLRSQISDLEDRLEKLEREH